MFVKDGGSYVQVVKAFKKINGIYSQFFGESLPAETLYDEVEFSTNRSSEISIENNFGGGLISKAYNNADKTLDISITTPPTSFALFKFYSTYPSADISGFIYEIAFELPEPQNSDFNLSLQAQVQRNSGDYATQVASMHSYERTRDGNGVFNVQLTQEDDFPGEGDYTGMGRVGVEIFVQSSVADFVLKLHSIKLYKTN